MLVNYKIVVKHNNIIQLYYIIVFLVVLLSNCYNKIAYYPITLCSCVK